MKKIPARFFARENGAEPVREWLRKLGIEHRKTIGKDIQKVEFGWPLGLPVCRPLGRGLWEVRSDLSDGRIARVIFSIESGEMVLLHGFIKKSQKAPKSEIDLAHARMRGIRGRM